MARRPLEVGDDVFMEEPEQLCISSSSQGHWYTWMGVGRIVSHKTEKSWACSDQSLLKLRDELVLHSREELEALYG